MCRPLLPEELQAHEDPTASSASASASTSAVSKRSPFVGVDFMGVTVSYPQYLRLVKLQEKVPPLSCLTSPPLHPL